MADKKMFHPDADTKHQITVREDAVSEYEKNGWVEVGSSEKPSDK